MCMCVDSSERLFLGIYALFFVQFQKFFLDFRHDMAEKGLKLTKRVENGSKKYFDQLLSACSTRKLVKIHNKYPLSLVQKSCTETPLVACLVHDLVCFVQMEAIIVRVTPSLGAKRVMELLSNFSIMIEKMNKSNKKTSSSFQLKLVERFQP